ncbi:MAG: hypothetical protein M1155_02990 [Patescibacteria group bacterium]|nr:hypothetical protein [Patescibacteria group bacterium]
MLLKLIKIILGLALIVAVAYFLFIKNGNWSLTNSSSNANINLSEKTVMNLASTTEQAVKDRAQSVFYDVSSSAKAKIDEIVASTTQQAKNYLFDIFKNTVESGLNSLGEKVGVSSGISTTTAPLP